MSSAEQPNWVSVQDYLSREQRSPDKSGGVSYDPDTRMLHRTGTASAYCFGPTKNFGWLCKRNGTRNTQQNRVAVFGQQLEDG